MLLLVVAVELLVGLVALVVANKLLLEVEILERANPYSVIESWGS
jgi:hypothetical protein